MITEKLKDIPKFPGCYLFKDDKEQIIYVGMSKYLPKRVNSYFQKKHDCKKTKTLVDNIRDVEFMIASSEQEALLLEEDLIKLYKPKFNIKGKDDKTRNWSITITEGRVPKLEMVREKPEGKPSMDFTNGLKCQEVYNLIHDVFPLRSCSYDLTNEAITAGKFKPCLEYHLGRCMAPCVNVDVIFQNYKNIMLIKKLFELNFSFVRKELTREMNDLAQKMEFEKANTYLHRLNALNELDKSVEPIRTRQHNKVAMDIKNTLGLRNMPLIVEAFDNSHNQGDCNVAASVRYVNQSPDKSNYRKYNIKTFTGANDYASFDEVLHRRFERLLKEKKQLPHLVLIDGGVGQLNVAKKVFEELNLLDRVDLISISKDDKHKSSVIHLTDGRTASIKDNLNFTFLGIIQEEVHRFAIKFHREKRGKKLLGK
jgi:excinuclease UvrABC nuclease subunit